MCSYYFIHHSLDILYIAEVLYRIPKLYRLPLTYPSNNIDKYELTAENQLTTHTQSIIVIVNWNISYYARPFNNIAIR